jgi:hypothetical protein
MRRREFITLLGGAAVWPLEARSQQPSRIVRIGFLRYASRTAKAATIANPVVFSLATDPEAEGPVSSIARPGANLTGLTMSAGYSWPARPAEHA